MQIDGLRQWTTRLVVSSYEGSASKSQLARLPLNHNFGINLIGRCA